MYKISNLLERNGDVPSILKSDNYNRIRTRSLIQTNV